MYKVTTADRMLQNLVCEYEKLSDPRLPACSRKSGHLLETCCTIMDLKGVGISKAGSVYGYVQKASEISQNYYPERLGKLYLINAPWGFSGVFAVIKRFLDPVTVSKIHVLGSGYKSELLAQVPADSLPKEFGGTCHCEGGCQLSDQGPCKLYCKYWIFEWFTNQFPYRERSAVDQDACMGQEKRQQHPSYWRRDRSGSASRWCWTRWSRCPCRPATAHAPISVAECLLRF